MKTIMFRMRIEPQLKQKLETAVLEGKAESMSELIRTALEKFLETCEVKASTEKNMTPQAVPGSRR